MTTSSSGFEAYFDADMVLVIAVCIKKERFSLKVTDCHIADGCWVCQSRSDVFEQSNQSWFHLVLTATEDAASGTQQQ